MTWQHSGTKPVKKASELPTKAGSKKARPVKTKPPHMVYKMQFCKLMSNCALCFIAYSLATAPAALLKAKRTAQKMAGVNWSFIILGTWLIEQPRKMPPIAIQREAEMDCWKVTLQIPAFQMSIVSLMTPKVDSGVDLIAWKTSKLFIA